MIFCLLFCSARQCSSGVGFRRTSAQRSSKELGSEIAALEQKAAGLKAEREIALAREKIAADAEAEQEAHREALALAEKKKADAEAEAKELKKKLKKK